MATESDKEAMERSAQFVEEFLKENGTSFKDKIIYEKNVSYYEGLEEGERSKAISIAKNLLSIPLTIEQIASSTGLSLEEIEALR